MRQSHLTAGIVPLQDNRISVCFEYEFHDARGQWYRAYGNEVRCWMGTTGWLRCHCLAHGQTPMRMRRCSPVQMRRCRAACEVNAGAAASHAAAAAKLLLPLSTCVFCIPAELGVQSAGENLVLPC